MEHTRLTSSYPESQLTITSNSYTVKNIFYKTLSFATVTAMIFSCKPQMDVPVAGKGSLDVTNYVAIGNSMTAGYADNALYYNAQLTSYPNLIAKQFSLVGGNDFKQPLVPAPSVGIGAMQNARMVLAPAADCKGVVSLMPTYAAQTGDLSIFMTSVAAQGPFHNLGIPGLKAVTTIYPGYGDFYKGPGNYNPFFSRLTATPETASVIEEAVSQNPTFFSLSIGNDDVYAYALAGGAADQITPVDGAPGTGFNESVDAILNALTANGAKGVVANIPYVDALPYFTTVPYNGLLLDNTSAQQLNAAYAGTGLSFHEGSNAFVIQDGNSPYGFRQLAAGEYVLLTTPQDSLKCKGWGSQKPIPHQYILDADEVTNVNQAISAYNQKLELAAAEKGLAFVNVNGFMNTLKSGIIYNGVAFNATFVNGGAFSLDGIHLTPAGNALLANAFIKSINFKYGSTLPSVDVSRYKGVTFP